MAIGNCLGAYKTVLTNLFTSGLASFTALEVDEYFSHVLDVWLCFNFNSWPRNISIFKLYKETTNEWKRKSNSCRPHSTNKNVPVPASTTFLFWVMALEENILGKEKVTFFRITFSMAICCKFNYSLV